MADHYPLRLPDMERNVSIQEVSLTLDNGTQITYTDRCPEEDNPSRYFGYLVFEERTVEGGSA